MQYTWHVRGDAARHELAGRTLPWLRNACRERGIAPGRRTKRELIDALVDWRP